LTSIGITTPDNSTIKGPELGSTTVPQQTYGSTTGMSTTEKTSEYSSTTPLHTTVSETTLVASTEDATSTSTERKLNIDQGSRPDSTNYGNKYYGKTNKKPAEKINSETEERVALIIGIIAGALIAVILIILAILKFKSRNDGSFKVDDGKNYQQGPNAALLGNASSTNGQTQYQLNGALRNGDKSQMQKSKKRDSKDIKEWYV
jgi:neurexin